MRAPLHSRNLKSSMLQIHSTKLKLALVAMVIMFVGIAAGMFTARLERTHLEHDLIQGAEAAAAAFDGSELSRLSGTRFDVDGQTYAAIKRRLQKLRSTNSKIRYVYLFRASRASPKVIFLGDSAPIGAADESLPGDPYPEADESPGLQSIIRTGQPAFEGPLTDSFGVWVTGYARTGDARLSDGPTIDVVGLDMSAQDWSRELWIAGLLGAGYTWLILGFPAFAIIMTRKQGEQREAIRNLSEAVEQSHSAIMILDLEHRIEYVNRGLCQQIGYSRRELIGRHWRDFLNARAAEAVADLVATVRSGHPWEGEWINIRKDGSEYPVHGMVTPVRHRDGAMTCFVVNFDDVTELKRKEAELREARDLARAGDQAKGHFLATMSHEVRTPLNGIVGFTSLLLDTPLSDEQREYVQTIRASGEALIQLTGDILDFARIESGKLKLDPIACDPRECIEEALDLHATRSAEKGIDLLHHAAENVPSAVVVDGGRLRQVLVNLIGNAVKFTERGEVGVSVRVLEVQTPKVAPSGNITPYCTLEFKVRDTGIGIPREKHSRLFKPFSQIDETSTRRYGGAGLGLAICKNLVELMGGAISLESEPGKGTTFIFTIHVPIAAPHPPQRQLEGMNIGLAIQPGAPRDELVQLLAGWGAEVCQTETPQELAERKWDIALVDVREEIAEELAKRADPIAGLPPEKTIGLVPISLSSELRTALRTHFRLLVNRPVHHGSFFALLSGSRPIEEDSSEATMQFGFRVLIVEDNQVNQRLLERVLDGIGCTYAVSSNGVEALAELEARAGNYDIVLLDLHMPEMDGLAALERIRRGDAGPTAQTLWIIALTADVRPEQRVRGLSMGLNDYLTKPLRVPELEAAFRRFRTDRLARKS